MTFREYLRPFQEDVIRKDKTFCELELKDGNNIFIEKRNGKYVMNSTNNLLYLSKEEVLELAEMLKKI